MMVNPFFLLLFFVLVYVAVLYESSAALALCLLFVFWFAGSILQLLYNIRKVQVDFPPSAHSGKENQAVFTLAVKNPGLLPVSGIRLRLVLLDQKGKKTESKDLSLSLGPRSRRKYSLNFSSPYCGRFQIRIKKLRLYSFFSLAWISRGQDYLGEALFFPEPSPIPLKLSERTRYFTPEGEDSLENPFLSSASGGFQDDVHSYHPGDPLRLVHWKLSARADELLVRSPGTGEGFSILLFLDLKTPVQTNSAGQISSFFQCAASLSFSMLEIKCSHLMIWFDQKAQCLQRLPIRNEEEMTFALYCLLHGEFYQGSKNLYALYSQEHPTDTWASRLLLDTGLELWQEDKKLLSSDTKNWKEDLALAEITL